MKQINYFCVGADSIMSGIKIQKMYNQTSFMISIILTMARGNYKKKRNSPFQKGHDLSNRRRKSDTSDPPSKARKIIRLTTEQHDNVINSPIGPRISTENPDAPLLLRPRQHAASTERAAETADEDYRLLAPEKVMELFNTALSNQRSYLG